MFSPNLVIKILDNSPKGSTIGTVYQVNFSLNSLGKGSFTYSIMDEVNLTKPYKQYLEFYSVFQKEKEDFEAFVKNQQDQVAQQLKEKRLSKNISKDVLDKIKTILPQFNNLILDYKNGKEKALNNIVGRTLKTLKEESIEIDPLLLKENILNLI